MIQLVTHWRHTAASLLMQSDLPLTHLPKGIFYRQSEPFLWPVYNSDVLLSVSETTLIHPQTELCYPDIPPTGTRLFQLWTHELGVNPHMTF